VFAYRKERIMRGTNALARLAGSVLALGLLAAACTSAGATSGGSGGKDGLSISIVSPADGATVSEPFTVKLDASAPIGDPSTGDDHVHLCFDGGSCDELSQSVIAYSNSVQITQLKPGTHTIEASLRNADHSDTGVSTTITVTVSGGGTSGASGATGSGTTTGTGSGGGYGY
jgi:Bacterial Ig domain